MAPPLLPVPRAPLIVLSKALQPSPGLHRAGPNNNLSLFTFSLGPLQRTRSAHLAFGRRVGNVKYALKSQGRSVSGGTVGMFQLFGMKSADASQPSLRHA